ncbi:MAG: kinase [Clostridiales bacterium]|jgi:adenylate kinase family enzyme|nr:kinase [Clostridiales bacterium]
MKPKIIILRGNSGSGKTTISKSLQKELGHGTLLISQDVVRREMLYVKDGEGTETVDLLLELIMYGKENCSHIILEGILYSDWYRRVFETIKDEFDNEIYAYYFDIPFGETLIRHNTRPNCNEFGEADMKRWWREKDFIGIISEHVINKDIAENDIIDMIIQHIN